MKLILILTLIVVIMLIANSISEQYKEKFDFYTNLKSFFNQFILNLSFKQEAVLDFLSKTKAKKQFSIFIDAYKDYLKNNILNLDQIKILSNEEKIQLQEMIKSIGQMDAQNETKQINVFMVDIEQRLTKAETDKNKLCPMILKLSLLFSIGLAILLI